MNVLAKSLSEVLLQDKLAFLGDGRPAITSRAKRLLLRLQASKLLTTTQLRRINSANVVDVRPLPPGVGGRATIRMEGRIVRHIRIDFALKLVKGASLVLLSSIFIHETEHAIRARRKKSERKVSREELATLAVEERFLRRLLEGKGLRKLTPKEKRLTRKRMGVIEFLTIMFSLEDSVKIEVSAEQEWGAGEYIVEK